MKHVNLFPVRHFTNALDQMMNTSISDFIGSDIVTTMPSANIVEHDDHYAIEVAAPGMDKKDFEIKLEGDQIVISATKEVSEEQNKENFKRREYNYSSFTRSFSLDDSVDRKSIRAEYTDGILKIKLGKSETAEINRKQVIEIS